MVHTSDSEERSKAKTQSKTSWIAALRDLRVFALTKLTLCGLTYNQKEALSEAMTSVLDFPEQMKP